MSSLKPDSLETIGNRLYGLNGEASNGFTSLAELPSVGDMYVQKHFVDLIVSSLSGLALDAQEYSRTWCTAVTSANFAQLPGRR